MNTYILFSVIILFLCILAYTVSQKIGIPSLLLFIGLGVLFSSTGILKLNLHTYSLIKEICSIALIIIIFYGGFNTNWKMAKPVIVPSCLLSTLGVLITTFITSLFCHFILHITLLESLLIGAVISSTDVASVFSILRGQKLNLKDGIASIIEVESGSNDPIAYMLTCIFICLLNQDNSLSIPYLLFAQIIYATVISVLLSWLGIFCLKHSLFKETWLNTVFVLCIAFFAFTLSKAVGGNGYLSSYIVGIALGNSSVKNKIPLIHFFDALTGLMQILIFFLLGFLSGPSKLPSILPTALPIVICLTLFARPLAVFAILTPFKMPWREQLFISWAGLRGAASIVFALIVVINAPSLNIDLFHIVFLVAVLSICLQGSFLPLVSKKLNLLDAKCSVLKTFNDYQEEGAIQLMQLPISLNSPWKNHCLCDINIPPGYLIVMVERNDEIIIPNGNTMLQGGDILVFSAKTYEANENIKLIEIPITPKHAWYKKALNQLVFPENCLIMMIKRNSETIIPTGTTVIQDQDIIVLGSTHLP